jgi:uncharacterized protein (TIGR02145 family)
MFVLYFVCNLYICKSQNVSISESPINPPHSSALLELQSSERGFLITRLTTTERDAIQNPALALMIFNTTTKCLEIFIQEWQSIWCDLDTLFLCGNTVQDIDGISYNTIQIGNQCWFKENLKTTTFSDGTPILNVTESSGTASWSTISILTPAYAWFDNDYSTYGSLYGAMYNFAAASNPNLCPEGWHVGSDDDWKELEVFMGINLADVNNEDWRGTNEGQKIKSCRQVNSPLGGQCNTSVHPRWNQNGSHHGTDAYGFSALPGGMRHSNGAFITIGGSCDFWTSTEAGNFGIDRTLFSTSSQINRKTNNNKRYGYYVRCLKN